MCAVRPIKRIRAYSRTPEHVARFTAEAARLPQIEAVACASGQDAVAGAGAVITVTNARQPVIDRSWLSPGTTVLCIARNEVDERTIRDSRVFTPVTQRLLDPGEEFEPFATWVPRGIYGPADVTEIGDVVVGRAAGRRDPDELLTFCSTGSGYWDVAIPMLAIRRARELGLGLEWP